MKLKFYIKFEKLMSGINKEDLEKGVLRKEGTGKKENKEGTFATSPVFID